MLLLRLFHGLFPSRAHDRTHTKEKATPGPFIFLHCARVGAGRSPADRARL